MAEPRPTSAGAPGTSEPAPPAFTKSEMMIVAAARELAGQRVCFVGVGLPNIAVNLAKRTVAPDMELVYEAGVFGAEPARLPLSIGDPTIVTGSTAVVSMWELFAFYLQGGLVDVGFLGAAQIDRFGNINTTVIGDYAAPRTRLPGSGGACEIAINARQIFVIMRQSARSFVDTIDFRTSPGNLGGAEKAERIRREQGWLGRGPVGGRHRPRDLALRRGRRDAPRLPPPGRHARRGPGDDRLGPEDLADAGDDAARPRPTSSASSARSSTPRACTRSRRAVQALRAGGRRRDARRTHDHDRAARVADDMVRHAAEEEPPHRAAPVRADDDEVGRLGSGGLDDRLARARRPRSGRSPRRRPRGPSGRWPRPRAGGTPGPWAILQRLTSRRAARRAARRARSPGPRRPPTRGMRRWPGGSSRCSAWSSAGGQDGPPRGPPRRVCTGRRRP